MGIDETKQYLSTSSFDIITRNYFDFQWIIGRGGFGKVWKVVYKKTKASYAIKEISKVRIIDRKCEKSIMKEKEILSLLPSNPFIVNMIFTFQDKDYLYFVIDLKKGGDLRYHQIDHKKFTEDQTKFAMACIILGLEHIHSQRIMHRDIKPENCVFDDKGYICITDFGIARKEMASNYKDNSGTLGYMAPEVLNGENHTYSVDYFALGIVGFELTLGKRPFKGKNKKEYKDNLISTQPSIQYKHLPPNWSIYSVNFINKLIQRKPHDRFASIGEMKRHKWFTDFNWDDLFKRNLKSPFIIKRGDNYDKSFLMKDKEIGAKTLERYQKIREDKAYIDRFPDFSSKKIPEELKRSAIDLTKVYRLKRKDTYSIDGNLNSTQMITHRNDDCMNQKQLLNSSLFNPSVKLVGRVGLSERKNHRSQKDIFDIRVYMRGFGSQRDVQLSKNEIARKSYDRYAYIQSCRKKGTSIKKQKVLPRINKIKNSGNDKLDLMNSNNNRIQIASYNNSKNNSKAIVIKQQ